MDPNSTRASPFESISRSNTFAKFGMREESARNSAFSSMFCFRGRVSMDAGLKISTIPSKTYPYNEGEIGVRVGSSDGMEGMGVAHLRKCRLGHLSMNHRIGRNGGGGAGSGDDRGG